MAKVDMDTARVRKMGNDARGIADHPLTKAKKAMNAIDDDLPDAKLNDFETAGSFNYLLPVWQATAESDVTNIRSVGDKLHTSANAVESGDTDSADTFPAGYDGTGTR